MPLSIGLGIYAAFFEFTFYTGMCLGEIAALKWDSVELEERRILVRRTVALKEDRTKTKKDRYVLLNDRAVHALEFCQAYADRRTSTKTRRIKEFPFCFPPAKASSTSNRRVTCTINGVQP